MIRSQKIILWSAILSPEDLSYLEEKIEHSEPDRAQALVGTTAVTT